MSDMDMLSSLNDGQMEQGQAVAGMQVGGHGNGAGQLDDLARQLAELDGL